MNKRYRVTLEADERDRLKQLLARGKADLRKLKHAHILLKADEAPGGAGWSDPRIAWPTCSWPASRSRAGGMWP
jgi:hypothetical protein